MVMMVVGLQNRHFLPTVPHEVGRQGHDPRTGIKDQPMARRQAGRFNTETRGVPAVLDLARMGDWTTTAGPVKGHSHNTPLADLRTPRGRGLSIAVRQGKGSGAVCRSPSVPSPTGSGRT